MSLTRLALPDLCRYRHDSGPALALFRPPRHSTLPGHAGVARNVRDDMRLTTVIAAVAVLGLGTGAAHANDRVGTIQSVGADGRTFTLDDGNVYHLQTNASPSATEVIRQMKAGQKIRVTYEANASAYYVSDI